jgi:hypothetical protein
MITTNTASGEPGQAPIGQVFYSERGSGTAARRVDRALNADRPPYGGIPRRSTPIEVVAHIVWEQAGESPGVGDWLDQYPCPCRAVRASRIRRQAGPPSGSQRGSSRSGGRPAPRDRLTWGAVLSVRSYPLPQPKPRSLSQENRSALRDLVATRAERLWAAAGGLKLPPRRAGAEVDGWIQSRGSWWVERYRGTPTPGTAGRRLARGLPLIHPGAPGYMATSPEPVRRCRSLRM